MCPAESKPFHLPSPKNSNAYSIIVSKDNGEVYTFIWTDENTPGLLLTLGRFASNPELSFTWYDAAVCSQKVRECRKAEAEAAPRKPR